MNSNYFCVGETVQITNGYLAGESGLIDIADGNEYRVCVEGEDGETETVWKGYEDLESAMIEPETPAVDETPEPAADSDRPTVAEARLIETITELRMAVKRAENEAASLRSQLDALRLRFAEMEAEYANS